MNEEDKIHINSFKFYDRDELEDLTKEFYLENQELQKQLEIKETKQKEFIKWLENKMKETHYTIFEFQAYRLAFEKFKEIIGE